MERRDFLKLTLGFAAAAAVAVAVTPSEAAPPRAPLDLPPGGPAAPEPAIATQKDVDEATAEPVQWGWRRRRYWGYRPYWGYRRRVIYFY